MPSITFKLSRLFQGASEIKNERITADLLFGTTRTACVFPFESIWGATSFKGSNIVWPESAPKEVLSQLEDGTFNQPQPPQPAEKKGDEEKSVAKDEKKPLQRGHLKRIK